MASQSKVLNPHDRFFKDAFRHQNIAAEEINRMLPPKMVQRLDLDRLTLDDTELLDQKFKELFSDRLFRVPTKKGGEVFVWILIEHQSRNDPLMALRVLEYATARWRASPCR